MDELAILKHTGDLPNLEKLLQKQRELKEHLTEEKDGQINLGPQPNADFFYDFDFLA